MKVAVVIPARMASSRFPGKPLKKILGRTMIEHVWRRACLCSRIDRVVIATCDQVILDECKRIGAEGIMTSDKHESCVDRVAEAMQKLSADVIINLQGDMPLVHPQSLEKLIEPFKDKEVLFTDMIGPIHDLEEENNSNVVKVVTGQNGDVLYYSREPLPSRRKVSSGAPVIRYKQLGINAYRRDSLKLFTGLARTHLEKIESVDMLRLLESGYKVRIVNFDYPSLGVDTEDDLKQAENLMQADQFYKKYARSKPRDGRLEFRRKVLKKFQDNFFKARIAINVSLGLPAQTGSERALYRKIIDIMAARGNLHIFEWGSGFSTVYYAGYLRKRKIVFSWDAIDNDNFWIEKIRGMISKRGLKNLVSIHVREFTAFWKKPGWDWSILPPPCGIFSPKSKEELEYIAMPRFLGRRFDIVFIDGRFRRHCLKTAKEVLKPGGIIVMHDAQKPHYYEGMTDLTFSKFYECGAWTPFAALPNKVWLGSFDNKVIFEQLLKWG